MVAGMKKQGRSDCITGRCDDRHGAPDPVAARKQPVGQRSRDTRSQTDPDGVDNEHVDGSDRRAHSGGRELLKYAGRGADHGRSGREERDEQKAGSPDRRDKRKQASRYHGDCDRNGTKAKARRRHPAAEPVHGHPATDHPYYAPRDKERACEVSGLRQFHPEAPGEAETVSMHNLLRPLTAALLLFSAGTLTSCSTEAEESRGDRSPTVGYVVLREADAAVPVTLAGRVVAEETSEVRPQVSGLVRSILFQPGGYVRAGQPLFQIDPALYRAAAAEARANLASAEASAQAASAKAARYKPLAEMEAVSRQDYDDAAAAARAARAAVAQQRASLDTANINLRFTSVPAPISGRIGRPLVTQGALVGMNQAEPLAVIQRTDSVFVDMQQSAAELTRLRRALASGDGAGPGSAPVRLSFDDGTDYPVPGTVQFSEATVNEGTGTVALRARFANPQGLLLPGMFVTAKFDQAVETGVILVPQAALLRDFNGDAYVYLVGKDGKAVRRVVQTERTAGANWVVTGGLTAGERLIVQGLNGLKAGDKVKPVPASTPQRIGAPPAGAGGGAGSRRGS